MSESISFKFMHTRAGAGKTKMFRLKNGDSCYVNYAGKYHKFQVDLKKEKQIESSEFVPGSIFNGKKVLKFCILKVNSG